LCSPADDVAWIKNGIGKFGLPKTIHGMEGEMTDGRLGNVINVEVPGVDHFADKSWWTSEWLLPTDTRVWKGPLDRTGLLKLLGTGGSAVPTTTEFQAIANFAAEGTRKTAWGKIFGDANDDQFEYTFSLTKGLMTGIYFDDKDVADYEVECISGACTWQIMSATQADWDKVEPVQTLARCQLAPKQYQ
jgi:hypothetical protein